MHSAPFLIYEPFVSCGMPSWCCFGRLPSWSVRSEGSQQLWVLIEFFLCSVVWEIRVSDGRKMQWFLSIDEVELMEWSWFLMRFVCVVQYYENTRIPQVGDICREIMENRGHLLILMLRNVCVIEFFFKNTNFFVFFVKLIQHLTPVS